jgi:hypothetical protein
VADDIGADADGVEVHIEGAVDAGRSWGEMDRPTNVRPAGVSLFFSFDIPLAGTGERDLARFFGEGAETASAALERMRAVFRQG